MDNTAAKLYAESNGYVYLGSTRKGMGITCTFECKHHGRFTLPGKEVLREKKCPTCSAPNIAIDGATIIHDAKRLKIAKCDTCNQEYKLVDMSGCPNCHQSPADDYLVRARELAAKYGGSCLENAYVNSKQKMRWRCANMHEPFLATFNNVNNSGSWCPECKSTISLGEAICRETLRALFSTPQYEYKFGNIWLRMDPDHGNMELDCYEKNLICADGKIISLALEYDGIQHFIKSGYMDDQAGTAIRDKIKDKYCKDNGIILLRVDYTVKTEDIPDNIKAQLLNNNVAFTGDIQLDYGLIRTNNTTANITDTWIDETNAVIAAEGYRINKERSKMCTELWVKCPHNDHPEYKTNKHDFITLGKRCVLCRNQGTTENALIQSLANNGAKFISKRTVNVRGRNRLKITFRCNICDKEQEKDMDNINRSIKNNIKICSECSIKDRGKSISAAKLHEGERSADGKLLCVGYNKKCDQIRMKGEFCKTCYITSLNPDRKRYTVKLGPCPGPDGNGCPRGLKTTNKYKMCRTCHKTTINYGHE